ncbi:MAG: class I SAM-dependent methyltransferase [Acetobacterales bacterium]
MSDDSLNTRVRAFWEQGPVGTNKGITGDLEPLSRDWFERVEEHRYACEPMIHAAAQFTRHRGERMLEIGVGAGTDHLQWARAGCECHGVDLTEAAIETTRARLRLYGLESDLQRHDAETLPFPDDHFDLVYSWGVIHHSEDPDRIVAEVRRVLKPGGVFVGMMYGRLSLAVLKEWIKHGLLRGRPWRSFAEVLWEHFESVGTKAYTVREMRDMFSAYADIEVRKVMTAYDRQHFPDWLARHFPDAWGSFLVIRARK